MLRFVMELISSPDFPAMIPFPTMISYGHYRQAKTSFQKDFSMPIFRLPIMKDKLVKLRIPLKLFFLKKIRTGLLQKDIFLFYCPILQIPAGWRLSKKKFWRS